MRNPYKPYRHTDGKWYVGKRRQFFPKRSFASKAEAKLEATKTYGRDLQEALDQCNAYVAKNDPEFRASDPLAYLA